ncbi:MAG: exodeoxyribonuclease III [Deltaproteobacteria bacterium HGW-Deltaproteobacteria-12]|nr:MAG: exodeoxyribonuclease III [Deltaproteobacteria bacterium HGW-Deltaproteobacteria-12]
MNNLKIATYNVNSIRSRLHIVLPWLQRNSPDYFCLQETKVSDDKFPQAEFADLGYAVIFKGHKQYSGVAIASRRKPQKVIFGLDDEPKDAERIITATFDDLTIINTYVPQGQDKDSPHYTYKLAWFGRLRKYLKKHFQPQDPLIWCGDLNVAPENIDVHDPKRILGHVCFNEEVWKAYEDVKSWGFVDVFRKHHPAESGQYTFFDYRVPDAVNRKLGWRVDHILATGSVAAGSKNCLIDLSSRLGEKPSDHVILSADF